jgi:hypothetical protein
MAIECSVVEDLVLKISGIEISKEKLITKELIRKNDGTFILSRNGFSTNLHV